MRLCLCAVLATVLAISGAFAQSSSIEVTKLPQASTPLNGSEVLYIIQNGASKQVPSSAVSGGFAVLPNVQHGDSIPAAGNLYVNSSGFVAIAQ